MTKQKTQGVEIGANTCNSTTPFDLSGKHYVTWQGRPMAPCQTDTWPLALHYSGQPRAQLGEG